jgi:hypothetical protein
MATPPIPALQAAERFGTEHGCDIETRAALETLLAAADATETAKQLAKLFTAVGDLLALPGGPQHASPDAAREYRALVLRARQAVVHHVTKSQTAQKRARNYLDDRIVRQAERVGTKPSKASLIDAASKVVGLSSMDVFSVWLVDALARPEGPTLRRPRALQGNAII